MKFADFKAMLAPQTHISLSSYPLTTDNDVLLWAGQIRQCSSQYNDYIVHRAICMPSIDDYFSVYIESPQ